MKTGGKKKFGFIREYGFQSIRFRNLLTILACAIIPVIVLDSLLFYVTYNIVTGESQKAHMNLLEKGVENVDSELQKYDNMLSVLSTNVDISSLSQFSGIRAVEYPSYEKLESLFGTTKYLKIMNPDLNEIYVYFTKSNTVAGDYSAIPFADFRYAAEMTAFLAGKQKSVSWIPEKNDSGGYDFILIYSVPAYQRENQVFLIASVKEETVRNVLTSIFSKQGEAMVLTPDGTVVSDTAPQKLGSVLDAGFLSRIRGESGYFTQKSDQGAGYFIFHESDYTGWKFVSAESLNSIDRELHHYELLFGLITVLVLGVALAVSACLNVKVSEPIAEMISLVDNREDWLTGRILSKIRFTELQHIENGVLSSFKENRELRKSVEDRMQKVKSAQYSALQAQINPHFLYNSLDSINWSIREKLGLQNETSDLMESLSSFLRYSLDLGNNLVCLADELENLKNYVRIEKYRYGDRFRLIWEIPEEFYPCKIVKVTLQPLLENAIRHGIRGRGDGSVVAIRAGYEGNEGIVLTVRDNGRGIEPDALTALRGEIADVEHLPSNKVGLRNVNLRYQYLFGEAYGVQIDSRLGEGTEVSVRLPRIL